MNKSDLLFILDLLYVYLFVFVICFTFGMALSLFAFVLTSIIAYAGIYTIPVICGLIGMGWVTFQYKTIAFMRM